MTVIISFISRESEIYLWNDNETNEWTGSKRGTLIHFIAINLFHFISFHSINLLYIRECSCAILVQIRYVIIVMNGSPTWSASTRIIKRFKVPYEISCFRKVKFTSGVKDKASKWTARNKRNLGSEWNKIKFQIEIEFSFASRFVGVYNLLHSMYSFHKLLHFTPF